jgi:hypothetical protein
LAYIWAEFEIRDPSLDFLFVRVIEMTIDDLLSEGKGSIESTAP